MNKNFAILAIIVFSPLAYSAEYKCETVLKNQASSINGEFLFNGNSFTTSLKGFFSYEISVFKFFDEQSLERVQLNIKTSNGTVFSAYAVGEPLMTLTYAPYPGFETLKLSCKLKEI